MFTGIVEHMGQVTRIAPQSGLTRLVVNLGPLDGIAVGDSVSVNGVCLTAVDVAPESMAVEVVEESLSRSTLGDLVVGESVNLERAMPATSRFGGHIVQGHVDGVGVVQAVDDEEGSRRMAIDVPEELRRYVAEKGSISIDGVSLTIAAVSETGCEVALIPHTLEATTLGLRKSGDRVNLEVDVIAKYVERILEFR